MQGSICQFGIRMCVRSRRKKRNKRDWQGLEGPGNKCGCLIMGIPHTVWHFLPSCPWALSAAEKNRALCSGMVLNGGPEQFPREETERLIEWVQCVARFFHYGHIFRRAVLTRRRLRLRVTSCLSLHTHTHREWGKEQERKTEGHRYGVNESHRKHRLSFHTSHQRGVCSAMPLWFVSGFRL